MVSKTRREIPPTVSISFFGNFLGRKVTGGSSVETTIEESVAEVSISITLLYGNLIKVSTTVPDVIDTSMVFREALEKEKFFVSSCQFEK